MRWRVCGGGLLLAVLATGCGSSVGRTNPYDPDAPPSVQAKARLYGGVVLEGAPSSADVLVVVTEAAGGAGSLSYEKRTDADGQYAVEVPAGTYNVEISQPGYLSAYVNNVAVTPGEERSLGVATLAIARGNLQGDVVLDDGGSPSGAVVSIIPLDVPTASPTTVLAAADGSYSASGLAAGTYLVRAEKPQYAPAYTNGGLEVRVLAATQAPELRLYPANAIVRVEHDGQLPARYTNVRDVSVLLLPFVEFLTDMRVSEDPTFSDPAWDQDFRTFNTPVNFTLGDIDGNHEIFAQFKDSLGVDSELFSTTIVLDRELPVVTELTLNNGAAYLTANDGTGTAALRFFGQDLLSGVAAYRWTTLAAFGDEPYQPIDSTGGTVSLTTNISLGDADGEKTVLFELRDRAGNVSELASATIVRDKTPPVVGTPAVSIDAAELDGNGAVGSLDVTLHFDVTADRAGEKLYVAVANQSGLDANADFVPLADPMVYHLADGPDDLSRQVCVMFRDEAGLTTSEYCLPVVVDRTGGISGIIKLEGETDFAGTLVQLVHPQDLGTVYSTTVGTADGAFVLDNVPGGSGYVLRYSHNGFVDYVQQDVTVLTGLVADRSTVTLAIPRTTVTGTVTYVDKGAGQHAGIVVSVDGNDLYNAVTGPNGFFAVQGLPARDGTDYSFTARSSGYLSYTFAPLSITSPIQNTYNLGATTLQKEQGDFRICAGTDATPSPCTAIAFTKDRLVRLDVTSTLDEWRVSLDPTFTGVAFSTFNAGVDHFFTFDAAEPDGQKTIYVQFQDSTMGSPEATKAGVVTLDTQAPVPAAAGAVVINPNGSGGGAAYTNNIAGAVTIKLAATDQYSGVANVRLANGQAGVTPDFSGSTPLGYQSLVPHNLDIATQGEKVVYAQFCDAVGNCTTAASAPFDSIIFDTEPPSSTTGVSVSINGGQAATSSAFVTVSITTGDAVAVRYGNSETLSGADFIAVDPGTTVDFPHILPLGDGSKTVYAQFVDAAGNLSPTEPNPHFATITLDTQPPTGASLSLAEGAYTNQDSIQAVLTGADAVEYILHIGDSEDFSSESWQPFTGTDPTWQMTVPVNFPLPLADGTYTVYAKLRDAAGNETTTLVRSITRDTIAPEFASVDIVEGDYTQSPTVGLLLFAVDATSMIIAPDGVIDSEQPKPFAPADSVTLLPSGVGERTVAVQYFDAAGNPSAVVVATTIVDPDPPEIQSFTILEGDYTNDTQVVLQIAATGAAEMKLSNNSSFTGSAWEPFATSRSWNLLPGDNDKFVYLRLRDEAGNVSLADGMATIKLDTVPPGSLSVDIAGGASHVATNTVDVDVAASDSNGVTEMMLANDPTFSGSSWVSYAAQYQSWPLTPGDGLKTVYVRFRDPAGNVSEKADTVTVDTQPPTVGLAIAGGATAIKSATNVPLSLTVSSDVVAYKLVEGTAVDCTTQTIDQPPQTSPSYTFSGTPADGTLALTACVVDAAGLLASNTDTVLLDTQAPSGALTINGGNGLYTNRLVVTLGISASDSGSGVEAIRIANTQDMTGVAWEPASSTRSWQLPSPTNAAGEQMTVWLEVRDVAGNVTTGVSANVWVDLVAPSGALTVDEGTYSQSTTVNLTIDRGGDSNTTEMALGEGVLDCSSATYTAFAATQSLTLAGGDGLKTIALCLRDRAGNTAGYSKSVTIDTQDPTGSLSINGGATYTTSFGVSLTFAADPDVTSYKVVNGTTIDCADPAGYVTPYTSTKPHNLINSDGSRTVTACLRDASGRYVQVSDSIFLDQTPPAPATIVGSTAVGIEINGGDAQTNSTVVTLKLGADDGPNGSGVNQMKVSIGTSCAGGTWQDYTQSAVWSIEPGDNESRSISVSFRDQAGNVSTVCSTDSIIIDTVDPNVTLFSVSGGGVSPDYTADANITLEQLAYVGNCSAIEVSEDVSFTTGVTPYPCSQTFPAAYTLSSYAADGSADGLKYIYARVIDVAGNASQAVSDTVVLDTGGPTEGGVIINNGAEYTSSLSLTLTLISSGASEMKVTTNVDCTGGVWEPLSGTKVVGYPDPVGPATLDVSVAFRDAAGNGVGSCYTDSIAYDPAWAGTGSITIVATTGLGGFSTSTAVDLQLDAGSGESGAIEMKIANGATCSGGTWEPFTATKSWTLASGGEGSRSVSVQYRDAAGNASSCYADSIDVDTVPPSQISVSLDAGAEYTTSATGEVALSVSATGLYRIYVSEDATSLGSITCDPSTWLDPAAASPYALSASNGSKTVYVAVCDEAGNLATSLGSDSIILDNQLPTGSFSIDGGATYTTDAAGSVVLSLSAGDNLSGVTEVDYRTSVDGITFGGWTNVPYQPSVSIDLAAPTADQDNVERFVEVRYHDAAGNLSATHAESILLDNVAPSVGVPVVIDGDASYTTSQSVTLTFDASASTALSMQISNGQGCVSGGAWQSYAGTYDWVLDSGGDDLLKYVSVRFRDDAGNTTDCYQDAIQIDTLAPSLQWVQIDNGAAFSSQDNLSLSISYAGLAASLYIGRSLDGAGNVVASAQAPSLSASYSVAGESDGPITLYVQLADAAGNRSNVVLDTITRDTTGPSSSSVSVNGGAVYTNDTNAEVELSLSAFDAGAGVTTMKVANGVPADWSTIASIPYQARLVWTVGAAFPPGEDDVTKTVSVRFYDAVGNASMPATDIIALDNVPPVLSAGSVRVKALNGNTTYTTSTQVVVSLSPAPTGSPASMLVSNSADCTGGVTYAYQPVIAWSLNATAEGATASVSVRVFDAAGNASACVSDSIIVDTVAPALSVLTLDGRFNSTGVQIGTDPEDTKDCYLRLANDLNVSGTYAILEFSLSPTFSAPFDKVASGVALPYDGLQLPSTVCSVDGLKYIYARAIDAAGNASAVILNAIRVDTQAPTSASFVLNDGEPYTNSLDMLALVGVPDDPGGIETVAFSYLSGASACSGTVYPYAGPKTEYAYSYAGSTTDGKKNVYMCLTDGAGNYTASAFDTIYYDTTAPVSLGIRAGHDGTTLYQGGTATGGDLRCVGGVPNDPHFVNSTSVIASLAGNDGSGSGIAEMRVAPDETLNGFTQSDFDAVGWMGWTSSTSVQLTSGDGPKMLSLQARDKLGATAEAALPVCLTLDTTPPENLSLSISQGAFTSTSTVDVTLSATDYQSGSAGMQMCFSSASSIAIGGIRHADGTLLGYEGDSSCSSGSAGWYPFETPLKINLLTGNGLKTIRMYVRDAAGNKRLEYAEAKVILDANPPEAPTLDTLQAGNKSIHVYWSSGGDTGAGIAQWRLETFCQQPCPLGLWTLADTVDGALRDYEITGLNNRYRYQVRVQAVDHAGNVSAYSNVKDVAVGWRHRNVAYSPTNTIIPFGVQQVGRNIYVGYLEAQIIWGALASTVKLAVSHDGGETWSTHEVDGLTSFRESAQLYVSGSAIVVVGIGTGVVDVTVHRPRAWVSTDQGVSWTATDLDSAAPHTATGVALAKEGGALVAAWVRESNKAVYVVRSTDGGASWSGVTYSSYTAPSFPSSLGACNTQFKLEWYTLGSTGLSLLKSARLGFASSVDETYASARLAAISCNDAVGVYPNDGKGYAVYTSGSRYGTGALALVENENNGSLFWDSSATTLVSSDVDPNSRPAIFATGFDNLERVFVAYRSSSGNLWVGESTDPDNAAAYQWVEVDSGGNAGLHPVMNGIGMGSPIIAATDESSHQLVVYHAVLPGPQVRAGVAIGEAGLLWTPVAEATNYEVTTGGTSVITPEPSFSVPVTTTTQLPYTTYALDTHGQRGEPGATWRLARPISDTIDGASSIGSPLSSTGALIVSGSNVYSLIPLGVNSSGGSCDGTGTTRDICLYLSINSGSSFTPILVKDMALATVTPVASQMALGSNGSGGTRLHVVYTDDEATPDLEYRRADGPNYTSWVGTDLAAATNTQDGLDIAGRWAQVSTSGSYVLVAWVLDYTDISLVRHREILYRYSTDYGGTWSVTKQVLNDTDLGYVPENLRIVDHVGAMVSLAWTDAGDGDIIQASTTNFTLTTPTWTGGSRLADTYHDGVAVAGDRYQDNWVIGYIGKSDLLDTVDMAHVLISGEDAQSTSGTNWATVRLDGEEAIADSLDVAVDPSGIYVAYATTKTLLGVTTRQIKLAYCKQECTGIDNWEISVLDVDDSTLTHDYQAIKLAVDSSSKTVYVSYTLDPGGLRGTLSYRLLRSGAIHRIE